MIIRLRYKWIAAFVAVVLIVGVLTVNLAFPNSALAQDMGGLDEGVRLPVIMYHHILKDTSRRGDYVLSPGQFENDLKYISENGYQTISCGELIGFFKGENSLPEKPILITFDDGYETVHEYAFPLLQKYNMKAIINVIGKHTDTFSKEDEPRHLSYSHASWEQLKEMSDSGIFEIGNHTYDMHGDRSTLRYGIGHKKSEDDEQYQASIFSDIGKLNTEILDEIGKPPLAFAYPFGSIPKESFSAIKALDFEILFTCEEKVNVIKAGTELPAKIKRFNRAGGYETYEFFNKLKS